MSEDGQEQGIGRKPMSRREFNRLAVAAVAGGALAALRRWLGGNSGGGSTSLAQEPTPEPTPTAPPEPHRAYIPMVERNFRMPEPGIKPEQPTVIECENYEQLLGYFKERDRRAGIDQQNMSELEIKEQRDFMRSLDPSRRAMAIVTREEIKKIEAFIDWSVREKGADRISWQAWLKAHYVYSAQKAREAGMDFGIQLCLDTIVVVPDEVAETHRVRRLESEGETGLTFHGRQHEIGPEDNPKPFGQPWDIDSLFVLSAEHALSNYPPPNGGFQDLCEVEGIGKVVLEGGIIHEWIGHHVGLIAERAGTRVGPLGDYYWVSGEVNTLLFGIMAMAVYEARDDLMTDPGALKEGEGYSGLSRIAARAMHRFLDIGRIPFLGAQPDGVLHVNYENLRRIAALVFDKGYRINPVFQGEDLTGAIEDNGYICAQMGVDKMPKRVLIKRDGVVLLDRTTDEDNINEYHELNFWHAVMVMRFGDGGRLPMPIPRQYLNAVALADENWRADEVKQINIEFDRDPRAFATEWMGVTWETYYVKKGEMENYPDRVAHAAVNDEEVVVWIAKPRDAARDAGAADEFRNKILEGLNRFYQVGGLERADPNVQAKQRDVKRKAA